MFDFLIGNNLLSAIFAFALVLIPAIFIHELGHFIAAKTVGITILEFGIGFPPRAAHLFTWRGTDFTLNYLPLGGFVRPLGEDMIRPIDLADAEKDRQDFVKRIQSIDTAPAIDKSSTIDDIPYQNSSSLRTQAVNEAKPLSRIIFMSAGAFANFVSAFVIFVIIALIGLPETVGGRIGIVTVDPASVLGQSGLQANDLVEDINGRRFSDSDDFFNQLQQLETSPATIGVRRLDPNNEEVLTTITFDPASIPQISRPNERVRVMVVARESPALLSGMLPGDIIIAFNDEEINSISELQELTQQNTGIEVTLNILRGNEAISLNLIPRVNPPTDQGSIGIRIQPAFERSGLTLIYQDGIPQQEIVSQPLSSAISYSAQRIGATLSVILNLPAEIIRGDTSLETARPVSVVGISQYGGRSLQQSIEQDQPILFLEFVALISIALGFTNLLPLPALDGGRILFVLIEIIRGRPITSEREGFIHLVGLALLLSITLIFVLNDLLNPITNSIP